MNDKMENKNSKSGKSLSEKSQAHKEHLGMEIPEGYFADSKQRILDSVSSRERPFAQQEKVSPKKRSGRIFNLNRTIAYPLAASILLLIAIAIGLQRDSGVQAPGDSQEMTVSVGLDNERSDDFLVRSLFVDDEEINEFTTEYLVEEIVVEAEMSEQQLENIFINSLFIDDSLVDDYLDESLMEQVVL